MLGRMSDGIKLSISDVERGRVLGRTRDDQRCAPRRSDPRSTSVDDLEVDRPLDHVVQANFMLSRR
jgi:hypothetical protein